MCLYEDMIGEGRVGGEGVGGIVNDSVTARDLISSKGKAIMNSRL